MGVSGKRESSVGMIVLHIGGEHSGAAMQLVAAKMPCGPEGALAP
jgi:hypothetical protein